MQLWFTITISTKEMERDMDTLTAFEMGKINKDKELMVFDWDKAATLIKESGATDAEAGLSGDWEFTSGQILDEGEIPTSSFTYLASTWATPELSINGVISDCYKMQSETEGWDSQTFWPDSAKKILRGE
jgi:hypothetical protein